MASSLYFIMYYLSLLPNFSSPRKYPPMVCSALSSPSLKPCFVACGRITPQSSVLRKISLPNRIHSSQMTRLGNPTQCASIHLYSARANVELGMTPLGDPFSSLPPSSKNHADLDLYQNPNNLDDQVFSALSSDGGIKVTVATVRNLLNDIMIQHSMNPVPGDALGRSAVCALMASNGMQPEQMFQLTLKGEGPLRGCMVIVTGKGETRGFVGNPSLGGDFTLQEAVGRGTVQVVKNHPDWPRPYNGITAIRHGDVDRDVGIYLAESEQRSCALAAGTAFKGVLCTAAGGYLVERLPDCAPETTQHMERNLASLVSMDGGDALPTNLLLEGKTPLDIASILLDGLDMVPIGQLKPKVWCECSEEKLIRSLRLLPRDEVDGILKEEGKIEARCQFCGKVYRMGPNEVENRLNNAKGDPSKDEEADF